MGIMTKITTSYNLKYYDLNLKINQILSNNRKEMNE